MAFPKKNESSVVIVANALYSENIWIAKNDPHPRWSTIQEHLSLFTEPFKQIERSGGRVFILFRRMNREFVGLAEMTSLDEYEEIEGWTRKKGQPYSRAFSIYWIKDFQISTFRDIDRNRMIDGKIYKEDSARRILAQIEKYK